MVSLTMAMLILFVVSNFFVHINRTLNAGFSTKNFSIQNVVYQKCVVSKQESNLA